MAKQPILPIFIDSAYFIHSQIHHLDKILEAFSVSPCKKDVSVANATNAMTAYTVSIRTIVSVNVKA